MRKNASEYLLSSDGIIRHVVGMEVIANRVRTDSKILFSRTFEDLQRPNFRVFQDSQNSFSMTFQDKFGSQSWLHKVQKVHISNQLSV